MSRDIAPFGVRMPPELKELVEAAAANNGRSINSEIVERLKRSFAGVGVDLSDIPAGVLLEEVLARFGNQVTIGISKELASQYGVAAKPKKKR